MARCPPSPARWSRARRRGWRGRSSCVVRYGRRRRSGRPGPAACLRRSRPEIDQGLDQRVRPPVGRAAAPQRAPDRRPDPGPAVPAGHRPHLPEHRARQGRHRGRQPARARDGGPLLAELSQSFGSGAKAAARLEARAETLLDRLGLAGTLGQRVDALPVGTAKLASSSPSSCAGRSCSCSTSRPRGSGRPNGSASAGCCAISTARRGCRCS